jgi:Fic family protein
MMAKENFWLMEYISISRAIKKSPSKYMTAYLYSETDSNDLTYFIVHQLEIIRDAIKDLHVYLAQKAEQQRETEYFLKNSALNGMLNFRQLELIRNALRSPADAFRRLRVTSKIQGRENRHLHCTARPGRTGSEIHAEVHAKAPPRISP